MKITCTCGALIIDQSDGLPHKAFLLPDQTLDPLLDALESEVIDAVATRKITREAAYHRLRTLLNQAKRPMWQCQACGRLYIDDPSYQAHEFMPATASTDRRILRAQ